MAYGGQPTTVGKTRQVERRMATAGIFYICRSGERVRDCDGNGRGADLHARFVRADPRRLLDTVVVVRDYWGGVWVERGGLGAAMVVCVYADSLCARSACCATASEVRFVRCPRSNCRSHGDHPTRSGQAPVGLAGPPRRLSRRAIRMCLINTTRSRRMAHGVLNM